MQTLYRITVRGQLHPDWSDWFADLTIEHLPNGEMVLSGPLSDQAALHGVLAQVRTLGLTLVGVSQATVDNQEPNPNEP